MEEFEFKRIIERYQQGMCSGKEKALLDEWFESLGKEGLSADWTKEDKKRLKQRILNRTCLAKNSYVIGGRETPPTRSIFLRPIFRMAASILLLAACTYVLWNFSGLGQTKEIATLEASSSEGISKVILPDGSIVWLKDFSTLWYPEKFTGKKRKVTLMGEGLFEVAKDRNHPFVIQCGELITTVLGTSFNIKTGEKDIEVIVLTGMVSLTSGGDKQGVIISPNEKAVYSMEEKQIAKVVDDSGGAGKEETIAVVATGTEYRMQFEDTRMEEVIRRIEGKFDIKIHTPNPKVRNCMITADFTSQSLDQTMDMIAWALGFEYKVANNIVVLRGAGCN